MYNREPIRTDCKFSVVCTNGICYCLFKISQMDAFLIMLILSAIHQRCILSAVLQKCTLRVFCISVIETTYLIDHHHPVVLVLAVRRQNAKVWYSFQEPIYFDTTHATYYMLLTPATSSNMRQGHLNFFFQGMASAHLPYTAGNFIHLICNQI